MSKSDKVKLQKNKKNKHDHFSAEINKVFLSPILQNLNGRSDLDIFFQNHPFFELFKIGWVRKFHLFKVMVKIKNTVIYPLLDRKIFPFLKRVLKNIVPSRSYGDFCIAIRLSLLGDS